MMKQLQNMHLGEGKEHGPWEELVIKWSLLSIHELSVENVPLALTGVAPFIGWRSAKRKVSDLIPGQDACLGCM